MAAFIVAIDFSELVPGLGAHAGTNMPCKPRGRG